MSESAARYATGGNGPTLRPHATGGNRTGRRRGGYRPEPDVTTAFSSSYDPRRPVEEQLRAIYRKLVAKAGGRSWHTHDSRRSDEGWPDEATILHGRLFFVELKAPGKKPTEAQVETLKLLNACRGVDAYLMTSSGDPVRDFLVLQGLLARVMA